MSSAMSVYFSKPTSEIIRSRYPRIYWIGDAKDAIIHIRNIVICVTGRLKILDRLTHKKYIGKTMIADLWKHAAKEQSNRYGIRRRSLAKVSA
jgi:hypothetical protein